MPDSTFNTSGPDRDLLLGILALQLDFVARTDLVGALQAWNADRSRPLGEVLVERNALSQRRRVLLDELTGEYLIQHGMDLPQSLAALCEARSVAVDIAGVKVGGGAPIVVQSMTNTDTADVEGTARQVAALHRAGSELVRITVDRDEAAAAVPRIKERLLKMGFTDEDEMPT